jgi:N-acetylglucosamine kinase-like BadF-type ATPase
VNTYLGIDGGGSKTAFLLVDASGKVLASHSAGPAYYVEIGVEAMRSMMVEGTRATANAAGISPTQIGFAFVGVPAYGEDSEMVPALDQAVSGILPVERYRCGNDAQCGWAGALAGQDGINIVAGTGSIAYGEFEGRSARAGGWGELFSDEGSAYWFAREGLRLFSRMSDGRTLRGPLHEIVRRHFGLKTDLDLCAAVYRDAAARRSALAALSRLVGQAAAAGDTEALNLFQSAADELAQMVRAVADQLRIPAGLTTVSYTGGMFQQRDLLLGPLERKLMRDSRAYRLIAPRLPPVAGAALLAARSAGEPLSSAAVRALENHFKSDPARS